MPLNLEFQMKTRDLIQQWHWIILETIQMVYKIVQFMCLLYSVFTQSIIELVEQLDIVEFMHNVLTFY